MVALGVDTYNCIYSPFLVRSVALWIVKLREVSLTALEAMCHNIEMLHAGAVRLSCGPEKHQVAEEDAEEQGGGPRLRVQQEESGEENSAKDKSNHSSGPGF